MSLCVTGKLSNRLMEIGLEFTILIWDVKVSASLSIYDNITIFTSSMISVGIYFIMLLTIDIKEYFRLIVVRVSGSNVSTLFLPQFPLPPLAPFPELWR